MEMDRSRTSVSGGTAKNALDVRVAATGTERKSVILRLQRPECRPRSPAFSRTRTTQPATSVRRSKAGVTRAPSGTMMTMLLDVVSRTVTMKSASPSLSPTHGPSRFVMTAVEPTR